MRTRSQSSPRSRLDLLALEDRTLPAVSVSYINGILTVQGDAGDDRIGITQSGGQVVVTNTGQAFNAAGVRALTVDGGDGNDYISIDASVAVGALVFGGYGNDTLVGGGGDDQLFGGPGANTLTGGTPGGQSRAAANSDIEAQIVTLVNQQRAAAGLPGLTASGQLNFAAQQHSANMAAAAGALGLSAAMQHTLAASPEPTLTSRADFAGYTYSALGENIAYGYSSAADVMQAWMNSPGHRANILNPLYTQIGVGVRATSGGVLYFTEEFGSPGPGGSNTVTAAPTPTPAPSQPQTPAPSTPAPTAPAAPAAPSNPAPQLYAVGAGQGGGPQVQAYDAASKRQVFNFMAYATNFRGGVNVATGDVTGDGYDDIVTAPGAGGGPDIKVYNGVTGQLVREFLAYEAGFTGGVRVATGDINGDGKADIITGAGTGGGPLVKVFSGSTGQLLSMFMAYDPSFRGGVSVSAGDVSGDGRADIVTGAGIGGGPHVKAFDGRSLKEFRSFFAYDPSFRGGVTVAAGDTNGDGKADIITGAGPGGGPNVRVYDGGTMALLQNFYAQSASYTGGVCVGCADLNGDGKADIITGAGPGARSQVVGLNGQTLSTLVNFTAYDPSFTGGVNIGA